MYEREQERFRTADAQVVGVSVDSRFANAAWAAQLGGISFPLLSDFYPHGAVAERYGVLNPARHGASARSSSSTRTGSSATSTSTSSKRRPDPAVLFEELDKLK